MEIAGVVVGQWGGQSDRCSSSKTGRTSFVGPTSPILLTPTPNSIRKMRPSSPHQFSHQNAAFLPPVSPFQQYPQQQMTYRALTYNNVQQSYQAPSANEQNLAAVMSQQQHIGYQQQPNTLGFQAVNSTSITPQQLAALAQQQQQQMVAAVRASGGRMIAPQFTPLLLNPAVMTGMSPRMRSPFISNQVADTTRFRMPINFQHQQGAPKNLQQQNLRSPFPQGSTMRQGPPPRTLPHQQQAQPLNSHGEYFSNDVRYSGNMENHYQQSP